MAIFELSARACTFTTSGAGFHCRQHGIFDKPLDSKVVEVKTAADLDAALKAFGDDVGAVHPTGFFVTERLTQGRAPGGYRTRRFLLEYDRRTEAEKVPSY